ncbi:unnamed protein product, partial [Didymodactylos carnosus]
AAYYMENNNLSQSNPLIKTECYVQNLTIRYQDKHDTLYDIKWIVNYRTNDNYLAEIYSKSYTSKAQVIQKADQYQVDGTYPCYYYSLNKKFVEWESFSKNIFIDLTLVSGYLTFLLFFVCFMGFWMYIAKLRKTVSGSST